MRRLRAIQVLGVHVGIGGPISGESVISKDFGADGAAILRCSHEVDYFSWNNAGGRLLVGTSL